MSFVLTLGLKSETWQRDCLNRRMEIARKLYNACLCELYKRHRSLSQAKEYKQLILEIIKVNKQVKTLEGNEEKRPELKALLKEKSKLYKTLFFLYKKFGLTEYSLHSFIKPMQHCFKTNIDSHTSQKIATRCFNGFEKLLKGKAKKVRFKKYGQLDSVEGKNNKSGIRFRDGKISWLGLEMPVVIRNNDHYAQEALLNKIKYCRIIRSVIKGSYRYYVQIILDGIPPMKIYRETGELKHPGGNGKVGIDIGTQTCAVVSGDNAKILELAPGIQKIQNEITKYQRKMDRSIRATNPGNFNPDGTVKRGRKLTWARSNSYWRTFYQLKELYRKQADFRKHSHNIQTNYCLSLGNKFYVEDMNFIALMKRVKKTEISEKTGKYKCKKRFGKSIANKAPAMFLSILEYKLKYRGGELIKVNPKKLKASQYNHIEDNYKKKSLSQRWNSFNDFKVQRDLYSAFLIMCTNDNLDGIDKTMCARRFERFRALHDKEINRLRSDPAKKVSSIGL